jgi:hypothetical protein
LDEVIIRLIEDEREYLDRNGFMSMFSCYYGIYGETLNTCNGEKEREILREYGLYVERIREVEEEREERMAEYEKYSLERERESGSGSESEEDGKRERKRERVERER